MKIILYYYLLFISKLTNTNTMFKQTISPLSESIRNVHSTDYYDYIERLKLMSNFFDVKDSNGLTPLFLCLQYSVVNPLLLFLFSCICNHKHQNLSSFNDFNNDMMKINRFYLNTSYWAVAEQVIYFI